jgi:serine protease inhibitor
LRAPYESATVLWMALSKEAREYFVKEGRRGGKARAANLTQQERSDSARKAVEARWAKERAQSKALREDAQKLLAQARQRQGEIAKNRGL